jgi:hypothetical protein
VPLLDRVDCIQKNWMPISAADGKLYFEYRIEPRVVLAVNETTGAASFDTARVTSHPQLFATQQGYHAYVRGSVPSVRLPSAVSRFGRMFLGLAHIKTGGSTAHYEHLFYVFEPHPPFALVGATAKFDLPSLHCNGDDLPQTAPYVQFAAGMVIERAAQRRTLLVSYGEKDCQGGFARIDLDEVLAAIGPAHRADADAYRILPDAEFVSPGRMAAGAMSMGEFYDWGDKQGEAERSKGWMGAQCQSACR